MPDSFPHLAATSQPNQASSSSERHSLDISRSDDTFAIDRERIVRSRGFRRLQAKSQVFVFHEGDHFRSRLTHCLEVAQVSRAIARALGLNQDLAEAIALAHDLGHPPFGHAGEDVLNNCMQQFGGFNHNLQTLRQVAELESSSERSSGLGLSRQCLLGLAKHSGPITGDKSVAQLREYSPSVAEAFDLDELAQNAGLEAQIAACADDITYNGHDIDDGLRSGLIDIADLQQLDFMRQFQTVLSRNDQLSAGSHQHTIGQFLIAAHSRALIASAREALSKADITSEREVWEHPAPLIVLDQDSLNDQEEIRKFLHANVYQHYRVVRMLHKANAIVGGLFDLLMRRTDLLPDTWQKKIRTHLSDESLQQDSLSKDSLFEASSARVVTDYIAGMTDAFALEEYARLFEFKPHFRQ